MKVDMPMTAKIWMVEESMFVEKNGLLMDHDSNS